MNRKTGFIELGRVFWFRYHWTVLAGAVFLAAIFELAELVLEPSPFDSPRYILELILQAIIVPTLLITMQRTETQKNDAINTLSLLESFVYQLNRAQSWDELIEIVVQFPRNIVPLAGTCLWIYIPGSKVFELELSRIFETTIQIDSHQNSLALEDIKCYQIEMDDISGMRLCNCPLQNMFPTMRHNRYCLSLADENSIVGLLHLYLPLSYKLLMEQRNLLTNAVPEIVLSIDKAMLRRKTLLQEGTIETERLRLASDLHDTLGQDLAYLWNKIDQLIENQSFRRPALIKRELHHMSSITGQAYQTVRNILAATRPDQSSALDARLLSYAQSVGVRANLDISLETRGQPQIPNPNMQFQIFLIFRELMANIEKHAHAHRVMIDLIWSKEELTMVVSDDGSGFPDEREDKSEHFGLNIIETRVREMDGHMLIVSAPNQGTRISIYLPLINEWTK